MNEKFQRFVLLMTAVLVMSFSISYVVSASTDLYTSWQRVFNAVWSVLFGGGSGTSTNTNTTNATPSTPTNQSMNTNTTPGATSPNVNIVSATGEKIGARIFMERDGANNSWIGAQGSGTDSQRVAIGFNSDPTTGLIKNIYMRTNDQMRLSIDSDGNLGVGGNIVFWGDKPTYRITNVASPVNDSDVATKGYVDAHVGGSGVCTIFWDKKECPNGWKLGYIGKIVTYFYDYENGTKGEFLDLDCIYDEGAFLKDLGVSGRYQFWYKKLVNSRTKQELSCAVCCK
jgi:hypothetical protein